MSKTVGLTKNDVLHIAKLANLQIQDTTVEMYRTQLEETINYVENLDELDTADVEPTSHSTRLSNIYFDDGTENTRQFSQKEALSNAKSTKKQMFVVKRIME